MKYQETFLRLVLRRVTHSILEKMLIFSKMMELSFMTVPGIVMPGRFLVGSRYFQEQAAGIALDRADGGTNIIK